MTEEENFNRGYEAGFQRAMDIAAKHIETACPYPKKFLGNSSLYALALRLREMGNQVEGHNWAEAYRIAAALDLD